MGLVGKRTSLSSLRCQVIRLTLALFHQAKSYGEDDQNDTSAYNFHTLNLQVAEPRHERPRRLKFGTASGKSTH